MSNNSRNTLGFGDRLILQLDAALRSLSPLNGAPNRPSPAQLMEEPELSDIEKRHAAGLMRVNHSGEVCAQALYQGQAMTAKLTRVRDKMEHAAKEEIDHLAWCEERINELHSHVSLLNPVWYALSFGIGATAGLIDDKVSLGFVAATEEQVCKHLQSHLQQLPEQDYKSRAVVKSMIIDEEKHGRSAIKAGGHVFPKPVKWFMSQAAKIMTATSYRI